jgi:hypothetical protein
MTLLRRTTQLALIAAVVAVGTFLILEVTDVIGNRWRTDLADGIRNVFAPSIASWELALLGAATAVIGITAIAAQLAPSPKGTARMLEVTHNDDGATRITGRATLRAVEHELRTIVGVTAATATMRKPKQINAVVRIDDRCNLVDVEQQARTLLDTPFWLNLGLPDIAITITVEFDPKPPRVR